MTPLVLNRKNAPDPILCRDQLEMLRTMNKAMGLEAFVSLLFWILVKNAQKFPGKPMPLTLVPFRPNLVQRILIQQMGQKNLVVKARQQGITTWFLLARLFLPIMLNPGRNGFLVSHRSVSAEKTFRMAHRALRWIGAVDPQRPDQNTLCDSLRANLLHTTYSNRRELVFDQLDSTLMIGSAEVEEEGQSVTIHHFVADEFSRWPGNPAETLSNIKAAIVPGGTEDIPCTANGMGGPFWEYSNEALTNPKNSPYRFFFMPWYFSEEYKLPVTEAEKDEIVSTLTAEELTLIRSMHKELSAVAHVSGNPKTRAAA